MQFISDSSAVFQQDRVFSQHQSALTLIKDRVENPSLDSFTWLDLACGRGQILNNIERVLSLSAREKIHYTGVDVDHNHAKQTERLARSLFRQVTVHVCALSSFHVELAPQAMFDVITCTNTVHEISPHQLATLFVNALERVTVTGFMFIYDMDQLAEHELGAIPWRATEIQMIFDAILSELGDLKYQPTVAAWPHRTCDGWNLILNRCHLPLDPQLLGDKRELMIDRGTTVLTELLQKKLLDTNMALENLCQYGPDSAEEAATKNKLLHDYWAIDRALGGAFRLAESDSPC